MPEEKIHEAKDDNWDLATKIYEELFKKGAGIGNASIPIISKILDQQTKKLEKELTEYCFKVAELTVENKRLKELLEKYVRENALLKEWDENMTWEHFKSKNKL